MFTPFKHDFSVEMTVIQEGWGTMIAQPRRSFMIELRFSSLYWTMLWLGVPCDTLLFQSVCSNSPSCSLLKILAPITHKELKESGEFLNYMARLLLQLLYSLWSACMCSFNFYLSDTKRERGKGNTEKELCCFLGGKIPNSSVFPSDGSLSLQNHGRKINTTSPVLTVTS